MTNDERPFGGLVVRVGSLFSGIGGLDLAVERALGATTIWQVEWDKNCQANLARHWPDAERYSDVTEIKWDEMEPVDVLCGGYPCQPFSHAGKRKGTDDDRHLWPYVARAIGELRPSLVILENVRGHLTLGGVEVVGDLAALGYDARWQVVRASEVGAPHRRERIFILATDADREGLEGHGQLHGAPGEAQAPTHDQVDWGNYEPAIRRWEHVLGRPAPVPAIDGRLNPAFVEWMMGFDAGWTDGMTRTQALKALGNAVCPQQGEAAIRLLVNAAQNEPVPA